MEHDLSLPGANGTGSVRAPQFEAPAGAPVSDVDPFSIEFFADPHRIHDELREAGPVVWLGRYGVWAVSRYQEVYEVLHDWHTFCSSRGVGISDFAKEKPWRPPSLVLETDPPEHDRARAVLNRVLSPAVMKELRARVTAAAEAKARALLDKRTFDAIPDLAQAFPLSVFPDAVGLRQDGREHLLPYAGVAFNAFGPDNELRRRALDAAAPHLAWVTEQCQRESCAGRARGKSSRRLRRGRDHEPGSGASGSISAHRRDRYDGQWHRGCDLLPGAVPGSVAEAARRPDSRTLRF
jgi:cytochrome P450